MTLPPLVPMGPELDPALVRRYSRHLLIPEIGSEGQRRLANAQVLVVGAGGLGSPVLMYLAAAGVGLIGVLDHDTVDESNLQRQIIHGQSDVGIPKVTSAAVRLAELNPDIKVEQHQVQLSPENALEIFADYDLIIDGTDNFATRYLVNDACEMLGLPYVWGSILRFDGQVSVFWGSPPPAIPEPRATSTTETTADAVPTQGVTYRDLYPVPPTPGTVPTCSEAGVFGALCASIGSVMATEAIKLICGVGEPLLGRVLVLEGLAMRWRTVTVRPNPGREPVTSLGSTESIPEPVGMSPEELCLWLAQRVRGERQFVLVDVRDDAERAIVALRQAEHLPLRTLQDGTGWAQLRTMLAARDTSTVVFHCKSGGRSAVAWELAKAEGFTDCLHLEGGIISWIRDVDPSLPSY